MAHRHGNTGRHYTTGRADRAYYDDAKYARRNAPYTSRVDKYARAAHNDDAPYNPEEPQFVPSESSREYYASMLADGFRLVDARPNPENVGIFQGIFALVDGVYPDIVSDEHRERHGFLTCMRGVQCMLARMTADA